MSGSPAQKRSVADDVASARRTLETEARGLHALIERIGPEFSRAVEVLAECSGKVVVSGLGKSGLICRKIAATLASTGTPATFLHAAEGLHGDLGVLARGDCLLAVSYSGTTAELVSLVAPARRFGLPVIALTGDTTSPLARASDLTLSVEVEEEACPLGLAPTTSTTVTLALGDALAIALLERRGFSEEDFGALHPGGALGRRLIRVDEIMHVGDDIPIVAVGASMSEALRMMSSRRAAAARAIGVTAVVDDDGRLTGVVTDGDVRRRLAEDGDLRQFTAGEIASGGAKTVQAGALAERALALMEEFSITSLFIVDDEGRPCGILHMHDLLRAGVV